MGDRCYCIFEGGGAKGIAHVGALAALEESNLQLVGFAGTSAGAIVAALAAAGYTSRDLFNDDNTILDRIDLDRTNIWGGEAHKPVGTPARLLGGAAWIGIRSSRLVFRIGLVAAVVLLILSSGLIHWLQLNDEATEFAIQATLVALLIATPFYLASPIADLRRVADSIDQAIALRLTGRRRAAGMPLGPDGIPVGAEGITFADMARAGRPALKIVATDITNRRLALFSADATPDVRVGDAVAASICLPGIFRPWRVGTALHYDGGLVSNLPAWAFDGERAIDRDAWTAVVEVGDPPGLRKPPRGPRILSSALGTALFGSSSLDTRGVDKLRSASLTVKLDLLDFKMSKAKAREVIEDARTFCRAELVYQIVVLPGQIENMCELVCKNCRTLLNVARSEEGIGEFDGQLRAGLLFPLRGESGSLINEFSYGFKDHSDERIRLPIASSIAGMTLREPRPALYADRDDPDLAGQILSRPEDRWTRKLLWKDGRWFLYVPFYHAPNNVWLVVLLDSDRALELTNPATTLTALVDEIKTILRAKLPQEAFKWL